MRILVTSAGGALAPLNIRLLKQCRDGTVWVQAVDVRNDAAGQYFADAFSTVPGGEDNSYVDVIAECVAKNAIDIVLPWSDEEALALAADRDRIERSGAVLACAPLETLQIMSDKAASYEVLAQAGIDLPQWLVAQTSSELGDAVEGYRSSVLDFAVKPTRARGNRGTIVVRGDAGEAEPYLASRELHMSHEVFVRDHMDDVSYPVMVMERLDPPAYDIDVLAQDGNMLRAMPRRRLNPAGLRGACWSRVLNCLILQNGLQPRLACPGCMTTTS